MGLVLGTNAGFVTTAPTADPSEGTSGSVEGNASALKVTSPSGAVKVTEIGWWCDRATEESNFEVGIYTHNAGDNEPEAVVGSLNQTNAKGTDTGWKVVSGLNISISENTIYWIAMQLDNTSPTTKVDVKNGLGRNSVKFSQNSLPSPWGSSSFFDNYGMAFYAVWEAAAGFTRKIKISGTFQDKPIKTKVAGTFVDKPIKIKVGGTFQDA